MYEVESPGKNQSCGGSSKVPDGYPGTGNYIFRQQSGKLSLIYVYTLHHHETGGDEAALPQEHGILGVGPQWHNHRCGMRVHRCGMRV
eukprot:2663733-Rhodomonas_salina.1